MDTTLNAQSLAEALCEAYSGRLQATLDKNGVLSFDYTSGQAYYAEYRRAAYYVLRNYLCGNGKSYLFNDKGEVYTRLIKL